uniref:RING-type domain-containing protein n=1 Tax=viral metagenome TaxID=1070528 RepID=A0A6C0CUN5_9ZZZZ
MSIQNMNEIPEITFDAFIGAMNLEKEFEAETIVQETIECPICMDPIDGNKNSVVTECGHKFHCSCLMKNSCHNGFDCPMCRSAMVEDMEDDEEEEDEHEDDDGSYSDDNSHADDNSDADEYDDEIHEIVIEDFDSLVEDICFYTNADFRRYPAENSVMIMLKITGNEDLMDDFDRHVVGEHTERILKLIDIYKRTRILNDHFKKQAEKVSQRKEQEMFAQEDIKIEVVAEKPVMTVEESIQKIKHVLKEISELNSYEFNLMKQVTPEIFHNKHKRTNISEFLRTLNLGNPRIGKNLFMENKNLIDEALNLLECKEKNE